jgi:hypothetical protein
LGSIADYLWNVNNRIGVRTCLCKIKKKRKSTIGDIGRKIKIKSNNTIKNITKKTRKKGKNNAEIIIIMLRKKGIEMNKEKKLEKLKKKFRKKYIRYQEYLDQFDCGINLARIISTTVTDMQQELDDLIEEMKKLELEVNGEIPEALQGVKFLKPIGSDG